MTTTTDEFDLPIMKRTARNSQHTAHRSHQSVCVRVGLLLQVSEHMYLYHRTACAYMLMRARAHTRSPIKRETGRKVAFASVIALHTNQQRRCLSSQMCLCIYVRALSFVRNVW